MATRRFYRQALLCAASTAALMTAEIPRAFSQDAKSSIEEVIVTGTRRDDRTVLTSTVPIDVISSEALSKTGITDTTDALQTQVLSLNVRRFNVSDGAAFVRPFSLRGLPPDETLLLINGKRRHRSAVIEVSNQPLARGAQGPDLATIPSIALKQVEVLRDGASAQYGSDAIAGVLNLRLRDEAEGATFVAKYGQFYAGDGADYQIQANIGLPLSANGFINTSVEYAQSKTTSRGVQRPAAAALTASGVPGVPNPATRWGNPDIESARMFFNSSLAASDTVEAYLFGNYSWSVGETGFFWRDPTANANIFNSMPLTTQPGGARFTFRTAYPGGFTPTFGSRIKDMSITGGAKGDTSVGIKYDLSASLGQSDVQYRIVNTLNPSLGPNSPTSFKPGTLQQREFNLNADATYPWEVEGLASPINVAVGAEFRKETFEQKAGDVASWQAGPFASIVDPDTGNRIGFAVGSSGFPGFTPAQAGTFSRHNWATYIDLDTDITERWSFGVAGRYEDFSDFGSTANWKVSSRYEFVDGLAARGAASSGFRAPTPGQSNYSDAQTNVLVATGQSQFTGTLGTGNPIARFFGAQPLKPEESTNLTAGIVMGPYDGWTATVDYFNIKVKNRIGVTANISVTAANIAAMQAQGIQNADQFQAVRFFGNFFDTRTQGIDFVVTKKLSLNDGSILDFSTALNYKKNKVTAVRDARAIDRERRLELEKFDPNWRANATIGYEKGKFSALARANYFGTWTDAIFIPATPNDTSLDQKFSARVLVDLEASYQVTDIVSLTIGGNNVLDTFPEKDTRAAQKNLGVVYPQFSPFGYNGGFWYARVTAKF